MNETPKDVSVNEKQLKRKFKEIENEKKRRKAMEEEEEEEDSSSNIEIEEASVDSEEVMRNVLYKSCN